MARALSRYGTSAPVSSKVLHIVQYRPPGETLNLGLNRADYVDITINAVVTMLHLLR